MYSGNHSPCHPLTTLLEAARELRDRARHRVLLRRRRQRVRRRCSASRPEHGLDEHRRPSRISRSSSCRASLSSADLHVVVMGDPFVGIVHPCKVYNIRTLGIPYLYIGPAREPRQRDSTPTFAAQPRRCAVRRVGTSKTRPVQPPRTSDGGRCGRTVSGYLVGRMIVALEGAALAPTAADRRFSRRRRQVDLTCPSTTPLRLVSTCIPSSSSPIISFCCLPRPDAAGPALVAVARTRRSPNAEAQASSAADAADRRDGDRPVVPGGARLAPAVAAQGRRHRQPSAGIGPAAGGGGSSSWSGCSTI